MIAWGERMPHTISEVGISVIHVVSSRYGEIEGQVVAGHGIITAESAKRDVTQMLSWIY